MHDTGQVHRGLGAPGLDVQCQPAWVQILALLLSSYVVLVSYLASWCLSVLFCKTDDN